MKTQEEVKEWLKNHVLYDNDLSMIMTYCLGSKINKEIFESPRFKGERGTFNDFVKWFETPNNKFKSADLNFIDIDALAYDFDIKYKELKLSKPKNNIEEKCTPESLESLINDCGKILYKGAKYKICDIVFIKKENPKYEYTIADIRINKDTKRSIQYLLMRKNKEGITIFQKVRENKLEGLADKRRREWVAKKDDGDKAWDLINVREAINVDYSDAIKKDILKRYATTIGKSIDDVTLAIEQVKNMNLPNATEEENLKPYKPQKGDCFYVEGNYVGTYYILGDYIYSCDRLHKDVIFAPDHKSAWDKKTHTARPATEEEKQTLIKAVEEKYKKTYCEESKKWVDVKIVKFKKELACLINRYSLEETFGNKPDYAIAETMIHSALNAGACKS